MTNTLIIQTLTAEALAPFGDVIDASGAPDKVINQGFCGRHHDLAKIDMTGGQVGISVFNAVPRELPYRLDMVERHPLGSQAFVPMSFDPFLVIVAPDDDGKPGHPLAFETTAGQATNFHRNVWHGVLTPLHAPGLFTVIDRVTDEPNLEEYFFDTPYLVVKE